MASILIVDDSRAIRQISSSTLRGAGFEVVEADDGNQGYERARRQKFELILSDLNMPDLDGINMTKKIRQLSNHRSTPILIVTTESQMAMKSDAKAAGANGWVVKPVEPKRLVEIVQQILATRA